MVLFWVKLIKKSLTYQLDPEVDMVLFMIKLIRKLLPDQLDPEVGIFKNI